jgi:hypothetical protein
MQISKVHHFSSHIPVLLYALENTKGDVLELGSVLFSTPLIHYWCEPRGRRVVSVESDRSYYAVARLFETELHQVRLTQDWHEPDLERPFDVVFIDHAPAEQRRVDVLKYAHLAQFIVVHDTNGRQDRHYHLLEIWSTFRHVYHYGKFFPQTTIASNFEPIGEVC